MNNIDPRYLHFYVNIIIVPCSHPRKIKNVKNLFYPI